MILPLANINGGTIGLFAAGINEGPGLRWVSKSILDDIDQLLLLGL